MNWLNRLVHKFRWKAVHGSKLPKANLRSCLLNLAARGFEPRHIIDVGANKGKWSREARRVFPDCGFTLIEPQEEMRPRLKRFCNGRKDCRYLLAGAGAQNGELQFTVHPNTVSSTFALSAEVAARLGLSQRTVPVVTLDHVVETLVGVVPDIVKVDAEGFEQEVVLGSESLLGKTEVFFLEAHFLGTQDNPSDLLNLSNFMAERGYVPYDFTWFGRRPFDNCLYLCELAFVRRDGYLRSLEEGKKTVYSTPPLDVKPKSLRRAA
jgi:FkbM family methyltransferase